MQLATYLLRLSPGHAGAVLLALDLYQRCAMGQFQEIGRAFEGKNGDWQEQRDAGLDEACERIKTILCPDLVGSSYYGIMSEKSGTTAHLCYEVYKSLGHRQAWAERPLAKGQMPTVQHDTPSLFPSGVTPRPECAIEDGRQPEIEHSGYTVSRELEALVGTKDPLEALKIIKKWKQAAEDGPSVAVKAAAAPAPSSPVKKVRSNRKKACSFIYVPKPVHSETTASFIEAMDDNWGQLIKCDEKAIEAGSLVGRMFTIPVADGKAAYQVTAEKKTMVEIQHCTGLGGDWADHYFGSGGAFPKAVVVRYVDQEKSFRDIFKKVK